MSLNSFTESAIGNNDLAYQLISVILGPDWSSIDISLGYTSANAASIIYVLLGTLNQVVLSVVVIMITVTLVQGVMGTASDGTPLGKKFSTLWTPVRGVIGVSLLVPIGNGCLSGLQIIMLSCVYYSMTFANGMSDAALDYLERNNGQLVSSSPSLSSDKYAGVINHLLKAAIIHRWMVVEQDADPDFVNDALKERVKAEETTIDIKGREDAFLMPDSLMTSITLDCNPDVEGFAGELCRDRLDLIQNGIWPTVVKFADTMVGAQLAGDSIDPKGYKSMVSGINKFVENIETKADQKLKEEGAISKEYKRYFEILHSKGSGSNSGLGWMALGSYYWPITLMQSGIMSAMQVSITFGDFDSYYGNMVVRSSNLMALLALAESLEGSTMQDIEEMTEKGSREGDDFSWFTKTIDKAGKYTEKWIQEGFIDNNRDIIINISEFGHQVLLWNEVFIGVALVSASVSNLGGFFGKAVKGVLGVVTGGITSAIEKFLLPLIAVCMLLFGLGLYWAYYVPAIPFIIWAMAVFSWLIMVTEALVAAPLWAAAHSMPEGDGFAGQHARQGYMLFFNVLLRPPLLVVGFIFALLFNTMIAFFMQKTFVPFFFTTNSLHAHGVMTILAMATILITLSIMLISRSFSLITYIPDHLMKWISQAINPFGDEQRGDTLISQMKHGTVTSQKGVEEVRNVMTKSLRKKTKA
jgi:conjugal transfer/type IV secretion protein DotA/TraY